MILILFSFIIVFTISVGFGMVTKRWINIENENIIFSILIGFFNLLIFTTFYAVFLPINFIHFITITSIALTSYLINYKATRSIYSNFWKSILHLSLVSKIILLFVFLLVLIHSSSLPILADNESYYIQTIKWLNQFGLVKGIANLHPFLGQHSGWHIIQSTFNLSFLFKNLNDINGFLIVLVSYFSLTKWDEYRITQKSDSLFISLLNVFIIVPFLFIASPSPDLPTLFLVPIIIYLFIKSFQSYNEKGIILILTLALLTILIKVTLAPILILPIYLIFRCKNIWKKAFIICFIALLSFIIKNLVITGYPLYPLLYGKDLIDLDWRMNESLLLDYYHLTIMYAWRIYDWDTFINMSFIEKFLKWLTLPKLNGFINKGILILLFITPFFIPKKKVYYIIYAYIIFQFIIFYITSPQYRFYLPILMVIGLFIATGILVNRQQIIKLLISTNIILLMHTGIFGLNFSSLSNNRVMNSKISFNKAQFIIPQPITQFDNMRFIKLKAGNLIYYSPALDSISYWQTYNAPLPAVNHKLMHYYKTEYNHSPQLRTNSIDDGMYSSPKSNK